MTLYDNPLDLSDILLYISYRDIILIGWCTLYQYVLFKALLFFHTLCHLQCLSLSHTEHGWAHGSNTVYSVIHVLTGTSIELQPCLGMSWYDLDSNVARVCTNKARIYSVKQGLSRFEHDLQTIFIRLLYGSKYGLIRSVTA